MSDFQLGHRVTHAPDERNGFVVGRVQGTGWNKALLPVAVEQSTRYELWPVTQVQLLPLAQQFTALGGEYIPPKGFPLFT
jgi:hypothetical protein